MGPAMPPAVAMSGVAAFFPRRLPFLRTTASQTSFAAMAKNSAISMLFTRYCSVSVRSPSTACPIGASSHSVYSVKAE